jgi:hypothetical protein
MKFLPGLTVKQKVIFKEIEDRKYVTQKFRFIINFDVSVTVHL